jgi:transposase
MPCPSRDLCIHSVKEYKRRTVTVRIKEHYEALTTARERELTADFLAEYARRAGIEGTISRSVRTCGVRRSKYVGLVRTHLQHPAHCGGLELRACGRVACRSTDI